MGIGIPRLILDHGHQSFIFDWRIVHYSEPYGFVGNIWVKQNWLGVKGDKGGGHAHDHDHMTLLVKGTVSIVVDDGEPKIFTAPTFIGIRKGKRHEITALENDVIYFCLFALRDVDGNVMEIITEDHLPNYR